MIKFNQNPWLKQYIIISTDLRKKTKNDFEKDFFKLINNAVFGKTYEKSERRIEILNLSQYKEKGIIFSIKPIIILRFSQNIYLTIEMKKKKTLFNKPVYSGHSILELSKILMHEFWYDYVKLKYGKKGFTVYIKTDEFTKTLHNMLKQDLTHQIMN